MTIGIETEVADEKFTKILPVVVSGAVLGPGVGEGADVRARFVGGSGSRTYSFLRYGNATSGAFGLVTCTIAALAGMFSGT